MWRKTLAYLGLVEDYDDDYADVPDDDGDQRSQRGQAAPRQRTQPPPEPPRAEPSNVRRIPSATSRLDEVAAAGIRPVPSGQVHVTNPSTFNDVQEIGERFRSGIPVIMNLAGASESVAKRLLDFASGLIYGLEGRIERVGDRVFLLTPTGVDVSTEERAKLTERGFFNQA